MLRTVLWIAGACVAVLVALAVSRGLNLGGPPEAAPPPVEVQVEAPAPAPEPAPAPPEAKPAPTPEDVQMQDDAAATGMTTVESDEAPAEGPPTN